MKTDEQLLEDLIEFIRNKVREYKIPMSRITLIENDLGITGEEAADLIAAFSKKYNVDIKNFEFKKYFFDEPLFYPALNKIFPLTIGDLETAIKIGRLDDSIIG